MAGQKSQDDEYEVSPLDSQFGDALDRQQTLTDDDDELITHKATARPEQAPIPVSTLPPHHEAPKEVFDSWQTKSREENLPIPTRPHAGRSHSENLPIPTGPHAGPADTEDFPIPVHPQQSSAAQEAMYTEVKGQPPSYDSIQSTPIPVSPSRTSVASPSTLQPDDPVAAAMPPRPEDKSTVGQLLSWLPPPPKALANTMPRLFQPIIIPQVEVPPSGETVPFTRCYSSILSSHSISQTDFLAFLDGLALSQAPNSALQGLRVFGAGVSKLRLPIIPIAGKGLAALASTGSGHSSSRARLYLERCGSEFFAPRGLRLSVVKDQELHPRLNIPTHSARLAPLTRNSLSDSIPKRRFEALAPYVCPLRFDVPPEDANIAGVRRLARKELDRQIKRDRLRLDALREKQWRQVSTAEPGELAGWTQRYVALCAEIRRLQESLSALARSGKVLGVLEESMGEMLAELEGRQRELQDLIHARPSGGGFGTDGTQGAQAELEEETWGRRLRWVIIENA